MSSIFTWSHARRRFCWYSLLLFPSQFLMLRLSFSFCSLSYRTISLMPHLLSTATIIWQIINSQRMRVQSYRDLVVIFLIRIRFLPLSPHSCHRINFLYNNSHFKQIIASSITNSNHTRDDHYYELQPRVLLFNWSSVSFVILFYWGFLLSLHQFYKTKNIQHIVWFLLSKMKLCLVLFNFWWGVWCRKRSRCRSKWPVPEGLRKSHSRDHEAKTEEETWDIIDLSRHLERKANMVLWYHIQQELLRLDVDDGIIKVQNNWFKEEDGEIGSISFCGGN